MYCLNSHLFLKSKFHNIGIYKIDSEFTALKNKLINKKHTFSLQRRNSPEKKVTNIKLVKPPSFLERLKGILKFLKYYKLLLFELLEY